MTEEIVVKALCKDGEECATCLGSEEAYKMLASCSNCLLSGIVMEITKGHRVPAPITTSPKCPRCGCETIHAVAGAPTSLTSSQSQS